MSLDDELARTGSTRFAAVNIVRQRANQLADGALPRVHVDSFDRFVPTAIRELEAGELAIRTSRGPKPSDG